MRYDEEEKYGEVIVMRTIPLAESLKVEFKSDAKRLSDDDLLAAVVCLANTEGGLLYVGVEDDGRISGLHQMHRNSTTLAALIANGTNPPLSVRCSILQEGGIPIAVIEVPKSARLVTTSKGLLQRRRIQADGTPQCVPLYPNEFMSRQSSLGTLDYSSLPVVGASLTDLDPLECKRLRQTIEKFSRDRYLLSLSDAELDGALGMTRREGTSVVPTVAGLLVIGREAAIRQHLPTHEVAFQVLQGTDVKANDFYRRPLLWTFERIIDQFTARSAEDELQFGLFRVPIPEYDLRAFREAFIHALVHRDYAKLGTVHVQWREESMSMSNPGGFVEGVTIENILVTEPHPRNPVLADIFKRLGLTERTGRGVDLIYQGLLRYGRPAPDYSRSASDAVRVTLGGGKADVGLLRIILQEETRTGSSLLPVDTLIALNLLRRERRIDTAMLASAIQHDQTAARTILERLLETGLVEAHGIKKGRTYTLSAEVYRTLGQEEGYIRQVDFDDIQQEQMILQFVAAHRSIARIQVSTLCRVSEDQAFRLLRKLTKEGKLRREGEGKSSVYVKIP